MNEPETEVFPFLKGLEERPEPFSVYSTRSLWTDPYRSVQMLSAHLNPDTDAASRRPEFIDRACGWIHTTFCSGQSLSVADFGCGPGLYASRLAAAGCRVTGIDFSSNSLHYARTYALEHGLPVRYIEADYLAYEADEPFDLILMIYLDYSALSPDRRRILLEVFRKSLRPGGRILMDVSTTNAMEQKCESRSYSYSGEADFWSAGPCGVFEHVFLYEKERVSLERYTIVQDGSVQTLYDWQQHFTRESIRTELESAGFRVDGFFADVTGRAFDPDAAEMAVTAVLQE